MRFQVFLLLSILCLLPSFSLTSCSRSVPHEGLTLDGRKYRQLAQPSEIDKQAGLDALKEWPTAAMKQRKEIADKLILGKVLIGKTEKELIEALGPSVGPKTTDGYIDWDISGAGVNDRAHKCLLSVRLKGEQVSDAYIFEER